MTNPETIARRITVAIAEYIGKAPEDVDPLSQWRELGIDSLDLVKLTQEVEDQFGVEIYARDIDKLKTVGDLIALVEQYGKGRTSSGVGVSTEEVLGDGGTGETDLPNPRTR